MASGYDRRGVRPARPSVGENQALEQYGFRQGLRADLTAREMPLDASPRIENIRFEQNMLRQDFGFETIGGPTQFKVLGLAEHRFFSGGDELQRIVRIVRDHNGFVVLQTWNGVEWLDSVPSNIPVSDAPMSMVSTQNKFVFTNGGEILVWDEPTPGTVLVQEAFPHELLRVVGPTKANLRLTVDLDRVSVDEKITATYDIQLFAQFYDDPKNPPLANGGYTVRVETVLEYSYDGLNFIEAAKRIHEHSFQYVGGGQPTPPQTFDIEAVTFSIPAAAAEGVKHLRFRVTDTEMITDNPTINYLWDWGYTVFSRSRFVSPPGVEYRAADDPGGTIEFLNQADAPKATFIAPFGDRLMAVRDEGDPQFLAASADGDITVWSGVDTYAASLLDTVHDPIDPLQALAFLSDNQAALLRARNIMRVSETGDPQLPIAVNPWIEGIGTESPFTVVQARDGVMFLGHNLMVYYWDGGRQPTPVGIPIHNELIGKLTGGLATITAGFDPVWEEYWLCSPVGTWVFRLGEFLDRQLVIWREREEIVDHIAVVRQF